MAGGRAPKTARCRPSTARCPTDPPDRARDPAPRLGPPVPQPSARRRTVPPHYDDWRTLDALLPHTRPTTDWRTLDALPPTQKEPSAMPQDDPYTTRTLRRDDLARAAEDLHA